MEAFALYLLKSVIWLTGFALVYLLFLRNERFFLLKRIYLVSGILAALFFPLISVHYQVELSAPAVNPAGYMPGDVAAFTPDQEVVSDIQADYKSIILFLYLSGIIIFTFRLIWRIRSLYSKINKVNITIRDQVKLIRASEFSASFTFFNYIFINPSVSEVEAEEIMNHELVHVRQKHWFDLLLVELLCLLQWANPFVWIYIRFIRLNHEYIADEIAMQRTSHPAIYKAALVNQLFSSQVISLANSFNYSNSKRRFDMMKKIVASPYRKLKILFVLPVFAIVFYAFAKPEYHYTEPSGDTMTLYQSPVIVVKEVKGIVVKEDGTPLQGVTIVVSGTSIGVITDAAGCFAIGNVPEDASLVFTCKSYKTQILRPVFSAEMSVKMLKDPDYKEEMQIRSSTPGASESPIIVIDDVITDKKVSDINPSDIAKITVLKIEEAIDKYGEKGKNGAMVIITRKKAAELGIEVPKRRQNPEDFPTFHGEQRVLYFNDWVVRQVKYPPEASAKGSQGRVTVNLTVEPDGSIGNVTCPGSKDPLLCNAVIEAVKASEWEPAKNPEFREPFPMSVTVKFELPDKVSKDDVYVVVEQMPLFPGGEKALFQFLNDNLRYPPEAREQKIEGRVIIRFIVSSTGKVEDAMVLKSVHPLLDDEAVRVVSILPDFTPGSQGGEPVNVYFMAPVTFALEQ
jgi:TonB family protein